MKKLIKIFKRIIISAILLYGYNLIVEPIDLMVPINYITIIALSIFGFPALFAFIIILVLIY